MALNMRTQALYWGIGFFAFFLIVWAMGDILLPFVFGGAIAYFLDPVADRLERMGASRMLAVAIIAVVSIVLFVVVLFPLLALIASQFGELMATLPTVFSDLQKFTLALLPEAFEQRGRIYEAVVSASSALQGKVPDVINATMKSLTSLVNLAMILVISPIVAIYLLYDWDRMVARIDGLLPRDHADTIRRLSREIDGVLSSFVRGMGSVCLAMATYYAIALGIVGLQFGVVVGIIAGLVTFIPYVGALFGGVLAIGLALFQFWGDWTMIGAVAIVFVIGQALEGNFITPRLVGQSVGLHPVWLLIALSAFGSLFGFLGMLIAVPMAAAIGVLVRFGVENYTHSKLYLGAEYAKGEPPDDA